MYRDDNDEYIMSGRWIQSEHGKQNHYWRMLCSKKYYYYFSLYWLAMNSNRSVNLIKLILHSYPFIHPFIPLSLYPFIHSLIHSFSRVGYPMPNSNNIALFRSKTITPDTVMQQIYGVDYIGVLKGNTMGTEFILYDNGVNPALLPEVVFEDLERRVLCKVTYKSNIAGKKPNAMQVWIPSTVGTRMNDESQYSFPFFFFGMKLMMT